MTEPRPFQLFTGGAALAATLHRSLPDLVEPQPTVVVTGSWLTVKEQMADMVAGPAETVWADGTQIDFNDQDAQVSVAVDAADAHFRAHLAG